MIMRPRLHLKRASPLSCDIISKSSNENVRRSVYFNPDPFLLFQSLQFAHQALLRHGSHFDVMCGSVWLVKTDCIAEKFANRRTELSAVLFSCYVFVLLQR